MKNKLICLHGAILFAIVISLFVFLKESNSIVSSLLSQNIEALAQLQSDEVSADDTPCFKDISSAGSGPLAGRVYCGDCMGTVVTRWDNEGSCSRAR